MKVTSLCQKVLPITKTEKEVQQEEPNLGECKGEKTKKIEV